MLGPQAKVEQEEPNPSLLSEIRALDGATSESLSSSIKTLLALEGKTR